MVEVGNISCLKFFFRIKLFLFWCLRVDIDERMDYFKVVCIYKYVNNVNMLLIISIYVIILLNKVIVKNWN